MTSGRHTSYLCAVLIEYTRRAKYSKHYRVRQVDVHECVATEQNWGTPYFFFARPVFLILYYMYTSRVLCLN